MEVWPNFFIAGAPKAGTSSLYAYLRDIPGIYMSKIKEPNYFSRVLVPDDHPVRPIRDRSRYLQLFSDVTTETVIGEASPTYLADPEAASLINEVAPEAKLLVILRNPVERAFSHYLMMVNNGVAQGSFPVEIERGLRNEHNKSLMLLRPEIGRYCEQLTRMWQVIDRRRTLVVIFREFSADPRGTLERVLNFLGIDHPLDDFQAQVHRRYGVARGPMAKLLFRSRSVARASEMLFSPRVRTAIRERFFVKPAAKPHMPDEGRSILTAYYEEDVRGLQDLLGRPLPWPDLAGASPR